MEELIENLKARLKEDPDLIIEIPVTMEWISQEEATELKKQLEDSDEELNRFS